MNLIHKQLQKLWLLGDKAAELANPALDAMKALAEQPAQQQEPEYAWPTVADYERDVGFQTNEAFRIAWNMARTTNRMLGHASSQPAQQEPVAWVEGEEIYWNNAPDLNDWIRQNGQPLYTSPPAQRKPLTDDTCTWARPDSDHMPDTWQADCGAMWTFTEGGPQDNGMNFCPNCGKPAIEDANSTKEQP